MSLVRGLMTRSWSKLVADKGPKAFRDVASQVEPAEDAILALQAGTLSAQDFNSRYGEGSAEVFTNPEALQILDKAAGDKPAFDPEKFRRRAKSFKAQYTDSVLKQARIDRENAKKQEAAPEDPYSNIKNRQGFDGTMLGLSAINSLGLGIPEAVTSVFNPDIVGLRRQYSQENPWKDFGANIAGAVRSPILWKKGMEILRNPSTTWTQAAKALSKSGALSGSIFGTTNEISENNAGVEQSLLDSLKDIAYSTAGGAIAAPVVGGASIVGGRILAPAGRGLNNARQKLADLMGADWLAPKNYRRAQSADPARNEILHKIAQDLKTGSYLSPVGRSMQIQSLPEKASADEVFDAIQKSLLQMGERGQEYQKLGVPTILAQTSAPSSALRQGLDTAVAGSAEAATKAQLVKDAIVNGKLVNGQTGNRQGGLLERTTGRLDAALNSKNANRVTNKVALEASRGKANAQYKEAFSGDEVEIPTEFLGRLNYLSKQGFDPLGEMNRAVQAEVAASKTPDPQLISIANDLERLSGIGKGMTPLHLSPETPAPQIPESVKVKPSTLDRLFKDLRNKAQAQYGTDAGRSGMAVEKGNVDFAKAAERLRDETRSYFTPEMEAGKGLYKTQIDTEKALALGREAARTSKSFDEVKAELNKAKLNPDERHAYIKGFAAERKLDAVKAAKGFGGERGSIPDAVAKNPDEVKKLQLMAAVAGGRDAGRDLTRGLAVESDLDHLLQNVTGGSKTAQRASRITNGILNNRTAYNAATGALQSMTGAPVLGASTLVRIPVMSSIQEKINDLMGKHFADEASIYLRQGPNIGKELEELARVVQAQRIQSVRNAANKMRGANFGSQQATRYNQDEVKRPVIVVRPSDKKRK